MPNFLDKVKQLIGGVPQSLSNIGQSLNDDKGWFQQGKFTPIKAVQQGIQNWGQQNPQQAQRIINAPQQYQQQVAINKQTPFFNRQNTPIQWAGKVAQEFKQRGPYEGIHGLTNPILMNPYIEPIASRVVSKARVKNYKAGRPNELINNILGQTNAVVKRQDEANIKGKDYGPEIYDNRLKQIPNQKINLVEKKIIDFGNSLINKFGTEEIQYNGKSFTIPKVPVLSQLIKYVSAPQAEALQKGLQSYLKVKYPQIYGKAGISDVGNIAGGIGAINPLQPIIGGGFGVVMKGGENLLNKQPVTKDLYQGYRQGFEFQAKLGPLSQLTGTVLKPLLSKLNPSAMTPINNYINLAKNATSQVMKDKFTKLAFDRFVRQVGEKAITGFVSMGTLGATQEAKDWKERAYNIFSNGVMGAAFESGQRVVGQGASVLNQQVLKNIKLGNQKGFVRIKGEKPPVEGGVSKLPDKLKPSFNEKPTYKSGEVELGNLVSGKGWSPSDRGAIPGEPELIYKNKVGITQIDNKQNYSMFSVVDNKGNLIGDYADPRQAIEATKYWVDNKLTTPPLSPISKVVGGGQVEQGISEPTLKIKGITPETVRTLRIKVQQELPQQPRIKIGQTARLPVRDISKPIVEKPIKIELETVEQQVARSLPKESKKVVQAGGNSLPDIVNKSDIDVKDKVNLLDYFRTPDRVLQKIGLGNEAKLIRQKYTDYIKELPVEIDKITQWSKQVPKESNQKIFKYLDGQDIKLNTNELKVAGEVEQYLSSWADRLNLPKDKRISHYITHIFEKDFIKKEFDPDLANLIKDKVAGSVYDPFLEKRLGKMGYIEDTWQALDAYVKRATRKVNMDEALKIVKEKAKGLEQSQFNYVKSTIDRINMRPTDLDNLLDNSIKSVFGYKFGQRPTTYLTRLGRQAVFRGTLGLNPGTALKNLTQGANTYAKLGEKYTLLGYWNALKNVGSDELQRVGVLKDNFIQDRTLNATKKFWERTDKVLFAFFDTAEKINRGSAYYGAKAKGLAQGMNEKQAIDYALKIVRDTQFVFGAVDTPTVLQSDIAKLFGQFQTFSLKQVEFLGEMVQKREFAGLFRYALASMFFVSTIGKLIGMEPKDFIPSFRIGVPPTLGFPVELGKAILNVPDKYGQERDWQTKVLDISRTLIPFIPAGTQIKKTYQGLRDTGQGYAETIKGRIKYPVSQDLINRIRGGVFGGSQLPEAQEYRKEKITPLGEKQSEAFKQSTDQTKTYLDIINKREQNKKIDVAKEQLKESGQQFSEVGSVKLLLQPNGTIKTIDTSFQPQEPVLTGMTELDKKLVSKFNSEVTKKKNDILDLYEAGKLTAIEADKMIIELQAISTKVSSKTKKGKAPKKISVRTLKVSAPKRINIKMKIPKMPKMKKTRLTFKKSKRTIRIKV